MNLCFETEARCCALIAVLGLVLPGCRFVRNDGYLYATADGNSIGRPAVILERVRTGPYRIEPPRLAHAHVEIQRVPVPMQDEPEPTPALEVSPTGFEGEASQPATRNRSAWLFR